jgi:hypothetical protein
MEDHEGAHDHAPTPPVVDAAALHPPTYDGPDRRRAAGDPIVAAITHAVRQAPTQNQPNAMWHVVADAAVVALGLLTLVLMFKLSADIHGDTRAQEKFREGISCFLIDSVQRPTTGEVADRQRAATEMLIRCGFIETPGNGGR